MCFKTMQELELWLQYNHNAILDNGSQGQCYKIGNNVFKIFLQYIDREVDWVSEYSKDEIMRFSFIENNTYIFPKDIIMVGNVVVGYITDYIDAKSLDRINPLSVDLDKFEISLEKVVPDVKKISDNGVMSYDVMYNILYGENGFNVIDTLDYSISNLSSRELYIENYRRFICGVRLFLIDGIFDEFIKNNGYLYDLCYDREANFVEFLKEFRMKLSENEGFEILTLANAKKSMSINKVNSRKYVRELHI